jgi:hypothetical protein
MRGFVSCYYPGTPTQKKKDPPLPFHALVHEAMNGPGIWRWAET